MILKVSECYFFCIITVEQEYPRYPKAYNSIFPVVNTISTVVSQFLFMMCDP